MATGSQKTLAQLITEFTNLLVENTTGDITPTDHLQAILNFLASVGTLTTDATLFGLFPYDTTRIYTVGQAATFDDGSGVRVWICKTQTAGTSGSPEAFDVTRWNSDTRADSKSVTTGGTAITFDTAFNTAVYALTFFCYDGEGNEIAVAITNRTASGFTVTSAENATFDYICKEYID